MMNIKYFLKHVKQFFVDKGKSYQVSFVLICYHFNDNSEKKKTEKLKILICCFWFGNKPAIKK